MTRRVSRTARALFVVCLSAWPASTSHAHELDPSQLELREITAGRFRVLLKTPSSVDASEPVLPARCRRAGAVQESRLETGSLRRWVVDCGPRGLAGASLTVGTQTLVKVFFANGQVHTVVLSPDTPPLALPEPGGVSGAAGTVVRTYGLLGVEHILSGFDHLAFVLGLLLLVRSRRRLVATVTAFTAGHSITLGLAVLGAVRVAPAVVEALIAASIVLLAVELASDRGESPDGPRPTVVRRWPWAAAMAFGLLHGFGFAGALARMGLPADRVPLALFAFNAGVEAGQLLFIAGVLAAVALVRRVTPAWPRWALGAPAFGLGTLATFWFLQRLEAFLA